VIADQRLHGLRRDGVNHAIVSPAEFLNEVPDQKGNVFSSLPQRRHPDWEDIQPIVQVGPEFLLLDHCFQIAIRRRDQAGIGVKGTRAA
jgi:hypothetical protein